jgi:RNA ligase
MNYSFPGILKIDDVLPYIEGKKEFKIFDKNWYKVINYTVALEETFKGSDYESEILKECRGLIFDSETGSIISRPYHKFFNVGERKDTQLSQIDLNLSHIILEKLDGSMIRPIPTKEGFRLGTKSGITDVSMNAEIFISDKSEYSDLILSMLDAGMTPIFEWCSRKNRIVIDYPQDQLILTAIRNTTIGNYLPYWNLIEISQYYNVPLVRSISSEFNNIQDIVNQVRKWDDGEGVIVRFLNGHMVKIKAEEYVLRHKSKNCIDQEKNVIEIIINDSVDDLIPLLSSEDSNKIRKFEKLFWKSVDDISSEMLNIYNAGNIMYPDKKDFAVEFVQKKILPIHAPIMYEIKSGKEPKSVIVGMIRKLLSSQTKIDQNRWLFGGLNWNYYNINTKN